MENRRDDEEAVLITIGAELTKDKGSAPPSKRRRLTRAADKGGASSSSSPSTRSSTKPVADIAAVEAEAEAAEAEEVEAAEPLKRKPRKAKVPFYYDKKAFTVSATSRFVKQLEKENWKEFMSFVKDNADPAEPTVEGSAALGVIEIDLGPPESQETIEMVPVQDSRPDVVVTEPIPQLELRPDVVVEKKSKNSSIGKMAPKFLIKSRTQRYVKQAKV